MEKISATGTIAIKHENDMITVIMYYLIIKVIK